MSKHFRIAVLLASTLAAGSAYAAGEMPQMDPTWYANQLLWLVIIFGAFYFVVARHIAPSIGQVLATRAAAINDAILEAEQAKRMAEDTRKRFVSEGADARSKAADMIANTQAANSGEMNEALAKIDHDISRKLAQADVRIGEAKAKALSAIKDATASLAQVMASKLLGREIPLADAQKALQALSEKA